MLDSYINKSKLLTTTTEITPTYLNNTDLNLISEYPYCSAFYNNIDNNVSVELHVYTPTGDYLKSLYDCDYKQRTNQLADIDIKNTILRTTPNLLLSTTNNPTQYKILLDLNTLMQDAGYYRGQFNVLTNIFVKLIGSYRGAKLYIHEISTDRTEVKLAFTDIDSVVLNNQFNNVKKCIEKEISENYFSTYLLNFSHNVVYPIVNFYFDEYDSQPYIYVKLYKPLQAKIKVKNTCWIVEEIAKPSLFPVRILQQTIQETYNTLRGPNFDIDISNDSTATDYKTWDDLVGDVTISSGSLISPNQQILNTYFSGSLSGIQLNINYRYFKNFIHFSSAYQRVNNFIYKLKQIEWYNDQIQRQRTIAQKSIKNTVNESTLTRKRDNIISLFDDFEKYLYFENNASDIYTNYNESNLYCITPYPKDANNQLYPLPNDTTPHSTDDKVTDYLTNLLTNAKIYDQSNVHALANTIPMFIRTDENNEQYELFIHMIGQYYDILWSYINALSTVNSREENLFDGMPNDLLWHVAQSLGMKLYNGWQHTKLIDYETSNNNKFSKKQNTYNIWRRILNNLPYLYKSKGTKQCIYALMSCFGLSHTFLTIKEYGGPTSDALKRSNNDITYSRDINIGSLATHFIDSKGYQTNTFKYLKIPTLYNPSSYKFMYIEFQLRTDSNYTYNVDEIRPIFSLYSTSDSIHPTPESLLFDLHIALKSLKNHTFNMYFNGASLDCKLVFNDNDWYTFLIGPFTYDDTMIEATICKQKYGNIVDNQSIYITPNENWNLSGSYIFIEPEKYQPIQIRKLRILHTNEHDPHRIDIENHTLNPNAYNNLFTDYKLIEYPLNKQYANEVNDTIIISSSIVIPNTIGQQTSSFEIDSFTTNIDNCFENNNEVAYIKTPSLDNDTLYNNKIRIENNYIPTESSSNIRILSNDRRHESSSFDNYSLDSNTVGIYYSPTDQLNNDIYNQLGYWRLEDYIGDPGDVWKSKYTSLNELYNKYISTINTFDLHTYFNILSEYDFTIFKYIETMIPMRCDLIDGVVIEQSILERSKFTIGKEKHQVKNNSYSSSINLLDNYEIVSSYDNIPIIIISSSYSLCDSNYQNISHAHIINNHNLMRLLDNDTIKSKYTDYNIDNKKINYTTTYTYNPLAAIVSESRCDDISINANYGLVYKSTTDNEDTNGKAYYWNSTMSISDDIISDDIEPKPLAIKYGKLQGVNLNKSIRFKNLKFAGCKLVNRDDTVLLYEKPLNNAESPVQITYVNDNTIISNTAGQTINKYNIVSAVNNVLPANNILTNTK